MLRYRNLVLIVAALLCCIALSYCGMDNAVAGPRGDTYAGATSCRQCHRAVYDSVLRTAHYNATAPAKDSTILGSFKTPHNNFAFEAENSVVMEKRDSGFYQVMYRAGKEVMARRFDILFGMKNGQTGLYWQGNNVYQLPVSYYPAVNNWGTSPGYPLMFPDFTRVIGRNCFECHSAYIKDISATHQKGNAEEMGRNTLVYGIDCERCHGPAAQHVAYQLKNPGIKISKFITTGKELNYGQKLDRCALCHAGNDKEKLKSRFLFKQGDVMADYFKEDDDSSYIDVHGNQLGLLSQSRCFRVSGAITCTTCHAAHADAGTDMAFYSQKCMTCHSENTHNFCTVKAPAGMSLQQNCIDCHMPKQASSSITFYLSGNADRTSLSYRTHRIAVYSSNKTK